MISTQIEHFRISNYDMQPMKQTGSGIVGLMLVKKVFQGRDITVITVVADHTISCGGLSKFFDGSLLDIGSGLHLRWRGFPWLFSDNATKTFTFSVPRSRFLPVTAPPKYASSKSITPSS